MILNKFKNIIKASLLKPFRYARARKSAIRENDRLLAMDVGLSIVHLAGTQVLPDRNSLLAKLPMNGVAAEVGVARGAFSENILKINCPEKFYLIDAWGMKSATDYGDSGLQVVKDKFETEIANGRVEIRRGMSWQMLDELPDYSLDWIYIDASHDYDSVKKDLATARKKVKKGGLIAGHDYVRWARFGGRFGVLEAVNEFCLEHGYAIAFLTLESNYNWSYALRKMDV